MSDDAATAQVMWHTMWLQDEIWEMAATGNVEVPCVDLAGPVETLTVAADLQKVCEAKLASNEWDVVILDWAGDEYDWRARLARLGQLVGNLRQALSAAG